MTEFPFDATQFSKIAEDHAAYLRDQSKRCIQIARTCTDQKAAYALEAMSVEFLEKAVEIEARLSTKRWLIC